MVTICLLILNKSQSEQYYYVTTELGNRILSPLVRVLIYMVTGGAPAIKRSYTSCVVN